jgi:hypothetical protein
MCFYSPDAEWYAEICTETDSVAVNPVRCDECSELIPVGGFIHRIEMQQYECCQTCAKYVRAENYNPTPCDPEDGHDYGETYSYKRCHGCHLILSAIRAVEIELGCGEGEALPSLEGMREELQYSDNLAAYRERALRDNPEIAAHVEKIFGRYELSEA